MKTKIIYIKEIDREITFYIGENKNDNFNVIDMGTENDLWFHANAVSSCHIVAILPENIEKKDLRYIIKMGSLLCKMNTNKLRTLSNIEIVYTQIKNVEKMSIPGCVKLLDKKIITI